MYLERNIESVTYEYLQAFPVIAITGPRQCGKSTMLKEVLGKNYTYVTFDEEHIVNQFYEDPKDFLSRYNNRIIFDEIQRVPELMGYLKKIVDENRQDYGRFVLTGSCQFSMMKNISESLAGRIGILNLLPLQFSEMDSSLASQAIYLGGYPELATRGYQHPQPWFSSYVTTYLEKDIRTQNNIGNLHDFRRLLHLLAANTSQLLNYSSYAKNIGVSVDTIKRWISILEASYIIYLLPPYYNNLGKRVIKSPKIYFYDTGLVSYLTGIETFNQYNQGPMAGAIFENYIMIETLKKFRHRGSMQELYFYRSSHGVEVDLLLESNQQKTWIEIKKSATFKTSMLDAIKSISTPKDQAILLYQGETLPKGSHIEIINYQDFLTIDT